jgi:hypothetical protein
VYDPAAITSGLCVNGGSMCRSRENVQTERGCANREDVRTEGRVGGKSHFQRTPLKTDRANRGWSYNLGWYLEL